MAIESGHTIHQDLPEVVIGAIWLVSRSLGAAINVCRGQLQYWNGAFHPAIFYGTNYSVPIEIAPSEPIKKGWQSTEEYALESAKPSGGQASRCENGGISTQPEPWARLVTESAFRRGADSPLVQQVTWLTCNADNADVTTPDGLWDIVIRKSRGRVFVLQTGLITKPVLIPLAAGDEYISISFKPGVFMPRLPGAWMLNSGYVRPAASGRTFWIDGEQLEIPTFENAEGLVTELVKRRIITTDEVVTSVVEGHHPNVSLRSVQRRFRRVLGLTPHHLAQISRAGNAVAELERGKPAIEVAQQLGYADQSHLIRSLRQIMGRTPGQIDRTNAS